MTVNAPIHEPSPMMGSPTIHAWGLNRVGRAARGRSRQVRIVADMAPLARVAKVNCGGVAPPVHSKLYALGCSMSVRSKSVLVTGGAGFIGSHLVDRLIADEPRRITVVDNFFLGNEDNLDGRACASGRDLEVIRLDAADLAAMQDVVTAHEVDTVFDLAVIPLPTSLTYPAWTVQTNVGIATTFCEIARRGPDRAARARVELRSVRIRPIRADGRGAPPRCDHAVRGQQVGRRPHHRVLRADLRHRRDGDPPVQQHRSAPEPGLLRRASFRSSSGGSSTGSRSRSSATGSRPATSSTSSETADLIAQIHDEPRCRGQVLNVATGVETSVNELVARILAIMGAPDHPVIHIGGAPGRRPTTQRRRRRSSPASWATRRRRSPTKPWRPPIEWYAESLA